MKIICKIFIKKEFKGNDLLKRISYIKDGKVTSIDRLVQLNIVTAEANERLGGLMGYNQARGNWIDRRIV